MLKSYSLWGFHYKVSIFQIFAAVGCTQAIIGFFNPIYNLIYRATMEWWFGFCYCLSSTILVFMITIVIYCALFWNKLIKKEEAEVNQQQEDQAEEEVTEL